MDFCVAFPTWELRLLAVSIHICLFENIPHTLSTYFMQSTMIHLRCVGDTSFSPAVVLPCCTVHDLMYVWAGLFNRQCVQWGWVGAYRGSKTACAFTYVERFHYHYRLNCKEWNVFIYKMSEMTNTRYKDIMHNSIIDTQLSQSRSLNRNT